MKIKFNKLVNFLGRNGMFQSSGVELFRHTTTLVSKRNAESDEPVTMDVVSIEPYTSTGSIGRASIEVPVEQATEVAVALLKEASPDRDDYYPLNDVELATVLAALRVYQSAFDVGSEVEAIASNNGDFLAMDADDIDRLCEKLNLGDGAIRRAA